MLISEEEWVLVIYQKYIQDLFIFRKEGKQIQLKTAAVLHGTDFTNICLQCSTDHALK